MNRAVVVALPGSRIVVMSGQGHETVETGPDLFVREVLRFLTARSQRVGTTGREKQRMEHAVTKPETPIGARVKVREDCRCPAELRGMSGTVLASYGQPGYAAFDVLFDNGRTELFWQYELTEVVDVAVLAGPRENQRA
jgi:hypothetical protein